MATNTPSVLIENIGALVTGDINNPESDAGSIYMREGLIWEVGATDVDADIVIDARGLTAMPGLIDSHSHPGFGDFTFTQNSVGWMHAYLHGGMTSLVSAGEIHLPGLPLDPPDARLFKYLAVLTKRCFDNLHHIGPRVFAGTLIIAPGLTEADFDELADEGIGCAKFLFYPYGEHGDEAHRYVRWCRERDIVVKLHSGGVSRSGVSRPAGAEVIKDLGPDIVAHVNGGPIPMTLSDIVKVVNETDCYLEIATSGNQLRAVQMMESVHASGALHRIMVGTDTPAGTGIVPRGMLRNIAFLASQCGVSAAQAVCMATGNNARAHRLDSGFLMEGKSADLVLAGKIGGSEATNALHAFELGEIPGIAIVTVRGRVAVSPRSEQTPPPEMLAELVRGG